MQNTLPATPENQIPPNSPEALFYLRAARGGAHKKSGHRSRAANARHVSWDDLVLIAPERDDANEQPPRDAGHPKRA
jgi:hypothetical protein